MIQWVMDQFAHNKLVRKIGGYLKRIKVTADAEQIAQSLLENGYDGTHFRRRVIDALRIEYGRKFGRYNVHNGYSFEESYLRPQESFENRVNAQIDLNFLFEALDDKELELIMLHTRGSTFTEIGEHFDLHAVTISAMYENCLDKMRRRSTCSQMIARSKLIPKVELTPEPEVIEPEPTTEPEKPTKIAKKELNRMKSVIFDYIEKLKERSDWADFAHYKRRTQIGWDRFGEPLYDNDAKQIVKRDMPKVLDLIEELRFVIETGDASLILACYKAVNGLKDGTQIQD